MNDPLKALADIVANANDIFYDRHKHVDTLMGIMDKTLREQGMNADAITIDCISLNKKIVFVLHDSEPDFVDIALGDKAGVIQSSSKQVLKEVNIPYIITMMEDNFIN
ncbi:MAG: hypothetical protein V5789_06970 [Colwellia sp.]